METRRAPRKTDAERGPLGAWAYTNLAVLDLSAEQVAHAVRRSPVTVRKIAGGSYPNPSAQLLNSLYAYFREVGLSRTPPIAIDPPPGLNTAAPPVETTGGAAYLELAQAIREMAEGVKLIVDRVDLDRVEKNEIRIGALEAQMAAVWSAIHPEPAEDGASPRRPVPHEREG